MTNKVLKAYYIMRKDLSMSPAKLAVQVGHGTDLIHRYCLNPNFHKWLKNDRRKIVVQIENLGKLKDVHEKLLQDNLLLKGFMEIWDNGLTEFEGKTLTGLVIFPLDEGEIPSYIKRLRLYK